VRSLNQRAQILPLSATTGAGTEQWYEWIDVHANTENVPNTH
jgi:Ni2+-binding GTPase involved in maturation of urease and hydrogenase